MSPVAALHDGLDSKNGDAIFFSKGTSFLFRRRAGANFMHLLLGQLGCAVSCAAVVIAPLGYSIVNIIGGRAEK